MAFFARLFNGKCSDALIKLLKFNVQPAVAIVFLLAAAFRFVTTTPLGTTMAFFCSASTDSAWTLTGCALPWVAEEMILIG